MAIEVKRAVESARQSLSEMVQIPVNQILLEEVELSEDHRQWMITLSYPPRATTGIDVLRSFGGREYKVVTLNADTGDFVSLKIRSLAAA